MINALQSKRWRTNRTIPKAALSRFCYTLHQVAIVPCLPLTTGPSLTLHLPVAEEEGEKPYMRHSSSAVFYFSYFPFKIVHCEERECDNAFMQPVRR